MVLVVDPVLELMKLKNLLNLQIFQTYPSSNLYPLNPNPILPLQ